MSGRQPRWWPTEGDEPDPRWSLANERTLLAYERTALGLVVAGFAIAGTHTVTDAPVWLAAVGLPLMALGALLGLEGRSRFVAAQKAMRNGEPLEAPRAAALLPWGLASIAVIGMVLAAVQLVVSG